MPLYAADDPIGKFVGIDIHENLRVDKPGSVPLIIMEKPLRCQTPDGLSLILMANVG
jgi:hypothetical protein